MGVFLGPHVVLTNDLYPRAINPDGTLKGADDWEVSPIRICYGAAMGARSVVLPGVTIGRFAMVGAGSVVTRDVPAARAGGRSTGPAGRLRVCVRPSAEGGRRRRAGLCRVRGGTPIRRGRERLVTCPMVTPEFARPC